CASGAGHARQYRSDRAVAVRARRRRGDAAHRIRSRGMRRFAALYQALDRSTGTLDKRAAMIDYFREAPPLDAAWTLWFLAGGKLRRIAASGELRAWIGEATGHPSWLIEDSYAHVGDLAETLTLLL